MDIDDHDFPLVRKNLNVISVLILILAYTNAKLNSLSFLGIQIDLDAHKLYVAMFILYLYFIWRFLTKLPLVSGFWNDFIQHYTQSEKGLKAVHNYERYKDELIAKSPRLKTSIEEDETFSIVNTSIVRFSPKYIRKLRLSFTFYTSITPEKGIQHNFHVDHDIVVTRFLFLKNLIGFSLKGDKFGDYLFPILPIILNLGFFLFAFSWQGSLYSLCFK
jgi:hypothetical protein